MSQVALDPTTVPPRQLVRRAVRKAGRLGVAAGDRLLEPLVPLVCSDIDDIPVVFIVGCPRSGSTLFYQAVVQSFRFAYMSNDIARFPRSGPVAARLLRLNQRLVDIDFSSSYGTTRGGAAPSEAGAFWDRVFRCKADHTVEPEDWPKDRQRLARRHLASFVDFYGAPFLCKNLWHSVRIEALNQAFPEAAFIIMRRDRVLMADSIIKQQKARQAQGGGFWSIRPRGLEAKMDLPLAELVGWQIALTEQAIEKARERLGQERFFEVSYEDFCRQPDDRMEQVGGFLQGRGIEVHRRAALTERFVARRHCSLSAGERAQVEAVLKAV